EYIRQGIDLILERHKYELPGEQLDLSSLTGKK
ncbi:MAG TPA: transcriptional regulator, partial [Deltaproteobacteria bacterium]|nr:transcriptional regulator [Deltaproteobacteria bacterium]